MSLKFFIFSIITGLLVGSFLFGTTACNTVASNSAEVKAAKPASKEDQEKQDQDRKIRSKIDKCFEKASSKKKEKIKEQSHRVLLLMGLLNQTHNLFKQSLACVKGSVKSENGKNEKKCESTSNEKSPFRDIYKKIELLYDSDGVLRCEKTDLETKPNLSLLFFEKGSDGSNEEIDLVMRKKQSGSKKEASLKWIAKFEFVSERTINVQMSKVLLKDSFGPLFSGASEMMDGSEEGGANHQIISSCKMIYNDRELIELNCPGVGQDADKEFYFEFSEFNFIKNDKEPLRITVQKKKIGYSDKEIIYQGTVPLDGNVIMKVTENKKEEDQEEDNEVKKEQVSEEKVEEEKSDEKSNQTDLSKNSQSEVDADENADKDTDTVETVDATKSEEEKPPVVLKDGTSLDEMPENNKSESVDNAVKNSDEMDEAKEQDDQEKDQEKKEESEENKDEK